MLSAVLGRLPGTTIYRNTQQYPEAYTYNGIVIVRIDAPMYFANTSYIKDRSEDYIFIFPKGQQVFPLNSVFLKHGLNCECSIAFSKSYLTCHGDLFYFFHRVRDYEIAKEESKGRGPEVSRIHFVILEMARKSPWHIL